MTDQFKEYMEYQNPGTPVWWAVMEFAQIKAEALAKDFDKFCTQYEGNIKSHGDKYSDGAIFHFSLTDDYELYIGTKDRTVTGVHIQFTPMANAPEFGLI